MWCSEWAGTVDAAVRGWLAGMGDRPRPGGVALVALGSYARREPCAQSDVDLLLLHDGWQPRDLEALVQAVCYPLWDAGLAVGHAVRTPKDAVRAAAHRLDTATALVHRRLVAGDPGLLDELGVRFGRWLGKEGGTVLDRLADADAERHARFGLGLLEPDLKDGVGALRDLGSLRWAAACVLGDATLDALVGARYLGAADRADLVRAGGVLLAARCALHLVLAGGTGKRGATHNQLRLDLQDEVAARLGMADGDELLRAVGLATRTVAHQHGRTWPRLLADARAGRRRPRAPAEPLDDDVFLVDGLVEAAPGATLAASPSLGLRAVAAAATRGVHLGRGTVERLRRELATGPPPAWDERGRGALQVALRAGRAGAGALADADQIGLLGALLPEWERVRGKPQRNPLHRLDLDSHGLEAATQLAKAAAGRYDKRHAAVWAGLADPDALVIGVWLHDVGKAWPGDHSVSGEAVVRTWLAHMGYPAAVGDRVGRLVRHHLLLPDAATQRDIDDPEEVIAVAVAVGDVETLDGLFLLAIADGMATGPAAWSPWKELLITQLYERTRTVLQQDAEALRASQAPEAVLAAAVHAGGVDRAQLEAILEGLPPRYLLNAGAEQLAVHARMLAPHDAGAQVRRRPGPVAGTVVVSLVARDRRGLFADCAGTLTGHGWEVLDARAFTRDDGVALDWFTCQAPAHAEWDRVERDLAEAARGDLDVFGLVARREARRDARPPALAAPIPVAVVVDRGEDVTRVEVRGPDAPGVLYRVARAFADAGVDLLGAQVATLGPEVRDAFFVPPDALGEGPSAEEVLDRLRDCLPRSA